VNARVAAVKERIAAAACRAGRELAGVTLVAVSKTCGPEVVVEAFRAGLRVFGENRIEEAGPKSAAVATLVAPAEPPAWHMVGHLQSRKAAEVLSWASMVHSVDSVKLAGRLSRLCAEAERELEILLEVNVSGEASKYGFMPAELPEAVSHIAGLPALHLRGLLTVAPIVPDPELARPIFAGLRQLRDELARQYPTLDLMHLSMGMTDDFEVAVEEGATLVRIGRAIFGPSSD
jgi:pyridoxal phosphate enzyme (YggS family)